MEACDIAVLFSGKAGFAEMARAEAVGNGIGDEVWSDRSCCTFGFLRRKALYEKVQGTEGLVGECVLSRGVTVARNVWRAVSDSSPQLLEEADARLEGQQFAELALEAVDHVGKDELDAGSALRVR